MSIQTFKVIKSGKIPIQKLSSLNKAIRFADDMLDPVLKLMERAQIKAEQARNEVYKEAARCLEFESEHALRAFLNQCLHCGERVQLIPNQGYTHEHGPRCKTGSTSAMPRYGFDADDDTGECRVFESVPPEPAPPVPEPANETPAPAEPEVLACRHCQMPIQWLQTEQAYVHVGEYAQCRPREGFEPETTMKAQPKPAKVK